MKATVRRVICTGLAVWFAGVVVAKDPEIKSAWPQAPINVDGTADQWAGQLGPLPDVPILLGVKNDGDYLYLCLKTSDPKVKAQIAHVGMTVWVNGAGKDGKGYGVRFPLGAGLRHGRGERPPAEGTPAPDPGLSIDGTKVELIGPTEQDRFTVGRADAGPIQAALGDDTGVMVIELRFPLNPSENHPLAVEAKPGATIAVGLETERPHVQHATSSGAGEGEGGEGGSSGGRGGWGGGSGSGGMGPGGMGGYGRGGGRHGGMGRGTSEGGADMPKPIKLWTRVTLATAPPPPAPAASPTGK